MDHNDFPRCRYETRRHGDIETATCETCASVEWFRSGRPISGDVAMAALFGEYDLVGRLDAVNAPGLEVLLYRPAPGHRRALDLLPENRWLEVAPSLHASHDGSMLLLSVSEHLVGDRPGGA